MPARLAAAMAMAAVNEGFIRISPRLGNDQPPAERPQRDDVPRSRERWTDEAGLSLGAKMITLPRLPQASRPRISAPAAPPWDLSVGNRDAGEFLEQLDDRRAVLFVEPLGARHLIYLLRHIGEQQRQAEPRGKRRLELLVLVRNVDRAARREVALQHARHPVLELHRGTGADPDHLIDLVRVEPGL